ncbi:MAG: GHKL domain-containing protein [Planctomycetes bacterium]|nr:GHKL domain-containing protein [Planctomycetota bacterium]MBL7143817.1 GHKL domain-containing protein [Phycisphaerae bacterium]
MKTIGNISKGNQLRWVVLLLAIAVILPTVCLLWFMSQAVGNERLAVRQKLTAVYQKRLETLSKRIDDLWLARIGVIEDETAVQRQPIEIFDRLTGRYSGTDDPNVCNAVIIYDRSGKLVYPVTGGDDFPGEFPEEFNLAWTSELADENYSRAIQLYEQFVDSVDNGYYLRYSALLGQIRCLRESGEFDKAVTLCREMAYGQIPENVSVSSVALIARARILLVNLKSQTQEGVGRSDLENLIGSAVNYTPGSGSGFLLMPSGTRIFLLRKALEIIEKSEWAEELKAQVLRAKELLSAEELSSAAIERYYTEAVSEPYSEKDANDLVSVLSMTLEMIESVELSGLTEQLSEEVKRQISTVLDAYQARKVGAGLFNRPAFAIFESWSEDNVRRLELPEDAFGVYHNSGGKTYLLLKKVKELSSDFDLCGADLEELGISYRITDSFGTYACGLKNPEKVAFLTAPLGKFFPSWNIEIHFSDIDIFETTANKQKVVYVWTGLLAIAVMVAAGLLATRVVGKQIRINKLKNDFIATVSHELKTPLASMRVLVDTLLEGSYRDQQQVTEYLQLVSKENERLTGLIDNFLTFSRMERNKQAFAMFRTSPAAIARDAAEAVKTKFSIGQCKFEVNIPEDLPEVSADRDAMVTVLINLLDNAYKYSYDNKQIELRVSPDDSLVCFYVSDKGRGMSRRSVRKIFNRFYQADSSLSRHVEGCGLGLSIAKFIVDAHKGTISVESKPDKGSTFTVKLQACS